MELQQTVEMLVEMKADVRTDQKKWTLILSKSKKT
jgi:hypothetical protein